MQHEKQQFIPYPKILNRWYLIPIAVLVLGVISITMLIWIYRIHEEQRNDFHMCDALMDIQNLTASSHLGLEEAIFGNKEVEAQEIKDDIDLAINLADALLNGGISEHGERIEPIKDLKWRKSAEHIKSLLIKYKRIVLKRLEATLAVGIVSSLDKEINEDYQEIWSNTDALEILIEKEQLRAQANWERIFLSVFLTWGGIVGVSIIGVYRHEAQRRVAEKGLEKANEQLRSQAGQLEKFKGNLEDLVEKRTMELVTANWSLEDEIKEWKETEKLLRHSESQLRHVSSKLLSIQEDERRRISGELHDDFGQALASLKNRLYRIQKKVNKKEVGLRDECGESLRDVGQIIENIRRFSHDLSPLVLEYSGLSAALRNLIDDFAKNYSLDVACDIIDIDHLLPREAHIVIYRIFQEVLNNIGKHAQATQVSVVAKRQDHSISFVLEDNGKGFAVNQSILGGAAANGIGLAILEERIRMLSGSLDLSTEEERGTRVSFVIPT